jgi:hypothetical protein
MVSKMAVNKPTGDNARKGAVRKRSQIKIKLVGKIAWAQEAKYCRQQARNSPCLRARSYLRRWYS